MNISSLDQLILESIVSHQTPVLNSFFTVITQMGSTLVITLLTIALASYLLLRRRYQDMFLVILTVAGSALITHFLKLFFMRPRSELGTYPVDTFSFPSGHATAVFAFFMVAAVILLQAITNKSRRRSIAIVTVIIVILVGFSRVYLGFHYVIDVLAGYFVAAVWMLLCMVFLGKWFPKNT